MRMSWASFVIWPATPARTPGRSVPLGRCNQIERARQRPCSRRLGRRIPVRVYTHGTLELRSGAASTPERLSSGVAKYGPPSEGSGMLLLEGSGTYSARPRVVTRCGGARPSWGPHPGLPWSQRPLQEDQSRYAENQPKPKERVHVHCAKFSRATRVNLYYVVNRNTVLKYSFLSLQYLSIATVSAKCPTRAVLPLLHARP